MTLFLNSGSMRCRLAHLAFLVAILMSFDLRASKAQTAEYLLTPLGQIPGAYSTIPTGLNDLGEVVGWAQFIPGTPSLVAWVWTPEAGFTVLPQPTGTDPTRAIDINNSGIIAGDGGFDSGEAWRFAAGSYQLLGTLTNPISVAAGINENGDIAGTARSTQFSIPHEAFVSPSSGSMISILTGGQVGYINNNGQVVGYSPAFRYTPGTGVEFLPALGSRTTTFAWGVNEQGDVAGEAAFASGSGHVPFVFTDQDGMQEIGNFGGQAGATSINSLGEVIGNYDPSSGPKPWVWSTSKGLRFLKDVVDLGNVGLMGAHRINEVGQIVVRIIDLESGEQQPALLTPLDLGGCDNDGTCSAGETCITCPTDCLAGPGGSCGNGICEAADGENCASCPEDCRSKQSGKPSGRYCCGDGGGQNPVSCSDPRCQMNSFQCTSVPAFPSCCGDAVCEGIEDGISCKLDCGISAVCGDGSCDSGENRCSCEFDCGPPPSEATGGGCSDGVDNDCDGSTDCDDADCFGATVCNSSCLPKNAVCASGTECCSGSCKRNGRCR